MSRPPAHESQRRTARFLQLVALGMTYRDAAHTAGITAERALDLVSDRDALDAVVEALGGTAA